MIKKINIVVEFPDPLPVFLEKIKQNLWIKANLKRFKIRFSGHKEIVIISDAHEDAFMFTISLKELMKNGQI